MLEARGAFSSSMLTTRASVIIKIMSPMIRLTGLRYQCHLMLISHEKHPLFSCSSCMRQLYNLHNSCRFCMLHETLGATPAHDFD